METSGTGFLTQTRAVGVGLNWTSLLTEIRTEVFSEAKWLSGEGQRQGVRRNKSQFRLRWEFLSEYGKRVYGSHHFILALVSLGAQATPSVESAKAVTWDTLFLA